MFSHYAFAIPAFNLSIIATASPPPSLVILLHTHLEADAVVAFSLKRMFKALDEAGCRHKLALGGQRHHARLVGHLGKVFEAVHAVPPTVVRAGVSVKVRRAGINPNIPTPLDNAQTNPRPSLGLNSLEVREV